MDITLTSSAAKKIIELVSDNPDENGLRISVNSGGCGGYQYDFSFENEKQDGDILIEFENAKLYVDDISFPFLKGCNIDYVDNVMSSSFEISNPNAVSSCGCGTSFSCTK